MGGLGNFSPFTDVIWDRTPKTALHACSVGATLSGMSVVRLRRGAHVDSKMDGRWSLSGLYE